MKMTSESKVLSDQAILLLTKIVAMIALGIGSLVLGMLPLVVGHCKIKKRQKSELSTASSTTTNTSSAINKTPQKDLLTSLLLCFGGGVLLFTTFLHLAPEVRESVERHQREGQLFSFSTLSMAELLFCIGFFLVYFVEEIVHTTLTEKVESSDDLFYRTVSARRSSKRVPISPSNTTITTVTPTSSRTTPSPSWEIKKFHYNNECQNMPQLNSQREMMKDKNGSSMVFVRPLPAMEPAINNGLEDDRFVTPEKNYHHHHHHHHHHHEQHQHNESHIQIHTHGDTSVRGLLTVIALSFHAIFEGLAVGLEPSIGSVIYLALAIATHKYVIAFCVGMELYVTDISTKTVIGYLSVFSMVTPLGIMSGLILGYLKNESDSLGPIPTILQGIATGTLLYVVFFEVLAREKANDKSGLLQLIAIIIGFCVMLGLQFATAHSHAHEPTACDNDESHIFNTTSSTGGNNTMPHH